jgi:hypothetical protein
MSRECTACRTIDKSQAKYCGACGGEEFRLLHREQFPYDAIAAFIGVTAVILFWLVRV